MSRATRFDEADIRPRVQEARIQLPSPEATAPRLLWPIAPVAKIRRIGESVVAKRKGSGRRHQGMDIFAEPGALVVAAKAGKVLAVVDGRGSLHPHLRRAGLFVDVLAAGWPGVSPWIVLRYLHLIQATVRAGDGLDAGEKLGVLGDARASGLLHTGPHLHFEIRKRETPDASGYGDPLDPLRFLPPLNT